MGLINKVDMVCLSPVGYGVLSMGRVLSSRLMVLTLDSI